MGMGAALKARQVVEHLRSVLAIELLVGAQALDLRKGLRAGVGVQAAHEALRAVVPTMVEDRALYLDIAAVSALVDDGRLLAAVRRAA